MRHYRAAIQAAPELPGAYNDVANLLAEQGEVEAAIPYYRRALEIQPDYGLAHANLAKLLLDQGEFEGAIVHL